MLYRRSAGKAVPAESLSVRPVDTHHTGGTEGPEREIENNQPDKLESLLVRSMYTKHTFKVSDESSQKSDLLI